MPSRSAPSCTANRQASREGNNDVFRDDPRFSICTLNRRPTSLGAPYIIPVLLSTGIKVLRGRQGKGLQAALACRLWLVCVGRSCMLSPPLSQADARPPAHSRLCFGTWVRTYLDLHSPTVYITTPFSLPTTPSALPEDYAHDSQTYSRRRSPLPEPLHHLNVSGLPILPETMAISSSWDRDALC